MINVPYHVHEEDHEVAPSTDGSSWNNKSPSREEGLLLFESSSRMFN
jgi:hypothetical protein